MNKLLLIFVFLSLFACVFAQFSLVQNLTYSARYGSAEWFDADEDGDLDLFTTGSSACVIYNNNGTTISPSFTYTGMTASGADCGDYDNDGDPDFVYNGMIGSSFYTRLLRCDGAAGYSTLSNISIGSDTGCQFGDYDNDGDLDILLTSASTGRPALIYRNDGNSTFTLVVTFSLLQYSAGIWCDTDNDGDLDVILTGLNTTLKLYRNDGNDVFTLVNTDITGLGSGSLDAGDANNDGLVDLIMTGNKNDGTKVTSFIKNNGNNTFTQNFIPNGVTSGTAIWGDYDNDGLSDFFRTGFEATAAYAKLYQNQGSDTTWGTVNYVFYSQVNPSAAWGDYNNDGKLDLFSGGDQGSFVYKSTAGTVNTRPTAPSNLTTSVSGDYIIFNWTASTDAQTPSAGLSYAMRIGTTPGGCQVVSPLSTSTGVRRIAKRGFINTTSWKIKASALANSNSYYCTVQAIDGVFAGSPFATEIHYQPIKVTYPNGTEDLPVNSLVNVTWQTFNPLVTTVNIYITYDNGSTWTLVNETPVTASLGSYAFTFGNTRSPLCRIKVVKADNSTVFDQCDAPFTIRTFAPTADYASDARMGFAPFTVHFSDLSLHGTSDITSRLWNFGDGTTSTEANPVHTFDYGYYTVSLTVANEDSLSSNKEVTYYIRSLQADGVITALSPVNFNFGQVPYSVGASRVITIQNSGTQPFRVWTLPQPVPPFIFSWELDNLPVTIQPGNSIDIDLWFYPYTAGIFRDSLVIESDAANNPRLVFSLSATSTIPQPAAVSTPSISRVGNDIHLSWNPVTATIYGTAITPDGYAVLSTEHPDNPDSDFNFLIYTTDNSYVHHMVANLRKTMFYRIVALKLSRGEQADILRDLSQSKHPLKWKEVEERIKN
ncbi:MAG TPA: FG-GAP-like repeat-containing protein [Candidatus Cloacimonadota bacterium]|nr:FG-GAP-like repeat-containing protein [Candidatus Cloacimonadota bacterium]